MVSDGQQRVHHRHARREVVHGEVDVPVAADVRARRAIEADRAKPRSTARWVTIGTVGMLIYLSFTGDFVAPYGTALGQVLLALYLSAYLGALVWMKRMARGRPLPRFIGTTVKGGAR